MLLSKEIKSLTQSQFFHQDLRTQIVWVRNVFRRNIAQSLVWVAAYPRTYIKAAKVKMLGGSCMLDPLEIRQEARSSKVESTKVQQETQKMTAVKQA